MAEARSEGDKEGFSDKAIKAVTALIPAEALLAHEYILSKATKVNEATGSTEIVDKLVMQWAFPGLLAFTLLTYFVGRWFSHSANSGFRTELLRMILPLLAYVIWAAITPTADLVLFMNDTLEWDFMSAGRLQIAGTLLGALVTVASIKEASKPPA